VWILLGRPGALIVFQDHRSDLTGSVHHPAPCLLRLGGRGEACFRPGAKKKGRGGGVRGLHGVPFLGGGQGWGRVFFHPAEPGKKTQRQKGGFKKGKFGGENNNGGPQFWAPFPKLVFFPKKGKKKKTGWAAGPWREIWFFRGPPVGPIPGLWRVGGSPPMGENFLLQSGGCGGGGGMGPPFFFSFCLTTRVGWGGTYGGWGKRTRSGGFGPTLDRGKNKGRKGPQNFGRWFKKGNFGGGGGNKSGKTRSFFLVFTAFGGWGAYKEKGGPPFSRTTPGPVSFFFVMPLGDKFTSGVVGLGGGAKIRKR